ncbi:MAG TPA: 2-C-methyl-D-erythritol 4-phosphate cytidylyltransferase [Acidimicrobiia bacterium]|nr:2-C-methyl-D-erythritol 4-phosphate cytidylyltransferase [Acidimicrobiia bacterium]
MTSTAAIVLAGGSGSRMGPGPNKPYLTAAGRPLLWYSLRAFELAGVEHVVVVSRPEDLDGVPDAVVKTSGGRTRTASEHAGLAAIDNLDVDIVMIHDAARPFLHPDLVRRLEAAAATTGGAVPALDPARPLWRRTSRGLVLAPSGARLVQTPQAFRAAPLRTAYRLAAGADAEAADTAEIVERFGDLEIAVVAGDPLAFKVTYREDIGRLEEAAVEWSRLVERDSGEGGNDVVPRAPVPG